VVVADHSSIVEAVCAALDAAGIAALGCTQAAKAFWFIQQYHPKLVILDVEMPGVNELEFLQQFRADPRAANLPVLLLTANQYEVTQRLPHYQA
jgi:DNA-binding response OmpR family regulator